MTLGKSKETSNLNVKLRSGSSIARIKPLFTLDSKCVIIASGSNIKIHVIQSGECIHNMRYHKTQVISLQAYKRNHLQVFSCSEDGVVARWDYTEGKLLQVYNMEMNVSSFYAPFFDNIWFVTKKVENSDHYRLYSLIPKRTKCVGFQKLISPVCPKHNTVAFGVEGKFIAAVHKYCLSIYNLDTQKKLKHLTGERNLECVSCHPSDFVVAAGDDQGRVLVWSNVFDSRKPIKSIYHWHNLPVGDIAFSTEGSYLYSGGGEAVLVKWNLFLNKKTVLPRLGAPITQLSVSPDNSLIVTAHNDNSLQFVNSQNNVIQVIQGLTQGNFQGTREKNILPTGLLYDSFNKALVMNGRPGHLQFYNFHEDKQLFNLDISGRNIISQMRENVILNTDVQKAAIDEKGYWLATAEYWDDEETSPQIWLKFWEYDLSKQTYVLNTNVILPHNKEINCITFRPRMSIQDAPLAVTTSNDCRFKVWVLKDDACFSEKQSWTCESMGCYRDLPPGDASFSEDGSLLAVAFENVATLWTVDSMALKAILCHEKSSKNIKQLVFGRESCCHLLICQNGSSIIVWNLLSLSLSLIIHTEVQKIIADVASDVIASFGKDQTLYLFRPNSPQPIYCTEDISSKPIVAAIFVPLNKEGSHFHEKSQLFFFDSDQNLFTLTDECDEEFENPENKKVQINQNLPVTPFGMLQAESKVSSIEIAEPKLLVDKFVNEKDTFDITCPTQMDPVVLCSKVLKSLLIPKKNAS